LLTNQTRLLSLVSRSIMFHEATEANLIRNKLPP
jgi:hypothetical protein